MCSKVLPEDCELRQNKYLNNIVKEDHRFIKKLVKPTMGFQSFHTPKRTLQGYETMLDAALLNVAIAARQQM